MRRDLRKFVSRATNREDGWLWSICRWVAGFLIATALTWVVGQFCVNEIADIAFCPEVDYHAYRKGTRFFCSEGMGTVHCDGRGILDGGEPLSDVEQHVIFWGDSHVESFQVGDENAVFTQFSRLARDGEGLRGIGIGRSGWDMAAYLHHIPTYSKIVPNVAAHVIIVSAADVLPNGRTLIAEGDELYKFASRAPNRMRAKFIRARAHAFWQLWLESRVARRKLRFSVGPVVSKAKPGPKRKGPTTEDKKRFWDRLLSTLSQRQDEYGRVVLVIDSHAPILVSGKIRTKLSSEKDSRLFMEHARARGFEVIDLAPVFADGFRRTGRLPRGFCNSRPGKGHWNRLGHELIAQSVYEHLRARHAESGEK